MDRWDMMMADGMDEWMSGWCGEMRMMTETSNKSITPEKNSNHNPPIAKSNHATAVFLRFYSNLSYYLTTAMRLNFLFLAAAVLVASSDAWVSPPTASKKALPVLYSTPQSSSSKLYTLDGEEIRGPITPLGNLILVKVKETLTATDGGILLPDEAKERATEGLVLAAGPGKFHPYTGVRITNPIKEGFSVLYGKFDGKEIMYNDDSCQMIRDDDCMLYYEGMSMKLGTVFPVRDYALIELDKKSNNIATKSGVVIASQVMADDSPCEGIVVKVGEGRMASKGQLTLPPVKVGERVKFKDYAGNDVMIEGKAYTLVKTVDILCSLNQDFVDKAIKKAEEVEQSS
jgi:chaperonin GroES